MVELKELGKDLQPGQSVAVDGVCLTAVEPSGGQSAFDVITETLKKTTLGRLKVGSKVNIERSLHAADRLEGHLVQGHVQGIAKVVEVVATDKEYTLSLMPPKELMPYCAPLGCVAINGVSLTIAQVQTDRFLVALIPTTLQLTNLGDLQVGDEVNIETDIVARQIVHWLEAQKRKK